MRLWPQGNKETFTLSEGPVTITYPDRLSEASLQDLRDYLDIFMRKAQRVGHDPVDEMKPQVTKADIEKGLVSQHPLESL